MAKCEKILICGFSGSGKSSLLKEIQNMAPDLDWKFTDLDQMILEKHGFIELSKLISLHGWDSFRLWERQALDEWLKQEGRGVLSLGGGALTPLVYDTYKPISKIRFCFLSSPFQDCWERLQLPGTEPRPLIKSGKEELLRIYEERKKIFSRIPWRIDNPKGSDLRELARLFWDEISLS